MSLTTAPLMGWKHWLHSTARLPKELFDCQPEQLNPFLETLMKHTWNSGWDTPGADIISIPDDASVMRNLLSHHGLITTENIIRHARATYLGTETCAAQNSRQLFQYLENS
eukprot:2781922-Ditylum_brightwellii.AAC.1